MLCQGQGMDGVADPVCLQHKNLFTKWSPCLVYPGYLGEGWRVFPSQLLPCWSHSPFMVRRRKSLIRLSRIILRRSRQNVKREKSSCYLQKEGRQGQDSLWRWELFSSRLVEQMWVVMLSVLPKIRGIQWNLGKYFSKQALLSSKLIVYNSYI